MEDVHLRASSSDCQPGNSCNGDMGMQMECESSVRETETVLDEKMQGNSLNEEQNKKEIKTDDEREGNDTDKVEEETNCCGSNDGVVTTSNTSHCTIDNQEAGCSK